MSKLKSPAALYSWIKLVTEEHLQSTSRKLMSGNDVQTLWSNLDYSSSVMSPIICNSSINSLKRLLNSSSPFFLLSMDSFYFNATFCTNIFDYILGCFFLCACYSFFGLKDIDFVGHLYYFVGYFINLQSPYISDHCERIAVEFMPMNMKRFEITEEITLGTEKICPLIRVSVN